MDSNTWSSLLIKSSPSLNTAPSLSVSTSNIAAPARGTPLPCLGETTEQYRARLYTSATYATLLRDLGVVSAASVPYTAAQRTADGLALTDTLYVDVRQVSALVGEGYPLLDPA